VVCCQCAGVGGRGAPPRQAAEGWRRAEPATAGADNARDDDDNEEDDNDDDDDPFDIPEESEDFTGLTATSSPDYRTAGAEEDRRETSTELELESLSRAERKEKLSHAMRHDDGSVDGLSPASSSRADSGRRKVSICRVDGVKMAFYDADTDTDTDSPNTTTILRLTHEDPREEIACVGRKSRVWPVGVGVGVGVRVGVVECQHNRVMFFVSVSIIGCQHGTGSHADNQ